MLSITSTWDMLSPEESISHWVLRSSHRGDITYRTAKEQRPLIGRGAREKELTAMPLCNAPPLKFHSGMFLQRPYEKRTPLGILWYTHDTILSWCRLVLGEPFLQSPWSLRNARLSDGCVRLIKVEKKNGTPPTAVQPITEAYQFIPLCDHT